MSRKVRIGITIGDYNGIGPELIVKTLSDSRLLKRLVIVVYGSSQVIDYYKKLCNCNDLKIQETQNTNKLIDNKVNLVNCINLEEEIKPGTKSEKAGKASFDSLKKCTEDLASNKIDVIVTAPISKELIQKAGFDFPGHTEYLANLSGENDALMILTSEEIRVALVTGHIPLSDVPKCLTTELILNKIILLENSLTKDFNIPNPKIAVLGLNPHAGENGKLGEEENNIIIPAIQNAVNKRILVFGPFPSDAFFGSKNIKKYDAVLAMYHDQGLTGFKTMCFDEGVNFTAGLPIVRTSPDHGTAFDIAGKNLANVDSFRNAIYLALDTYKNRLSYKELRKNILITNTNT